MILTPIKHIKKHKTSLIHIKDEDEGEDEEEDEDAVGLEEEVELLLRQSVFNKDRRLWISCVGGTAGSGKTTLVRQVYNRAAVVDQFERRAWVTVSIELTHKEVLMKLIQQVVGVEKLRRDSLLRKMDRADNASLQQMLHRCLQGRQYFIVLDGLPRETRLECFLKGLPDEEEKGSRLLLTSTCASLTIRTNMHNGQVTKPLDSDNSWKLFSKTISKLTSEDISPLERKGRQVLLTKCEGLPLAIKDLGRQLAEKRQSAGCEWEQLFESIDFGSTLELLEEFYQKFNRKHKLCFWHLAFFKENTTLRKEKLILIWAAGGIGSESECLSHVTDLLCEFIIQMVDPGSDFRAKRCRINAMLHRLFIRKAEEKGLEILRNTGIDRPSKYPQHRVVVCSREKFNYSMNQDKNIVSLIFHGGGYLDVSQFDWSSLALLRILDLDDFGLKSLPESIGKLMSLKYLGLRNNHIQALPDSLGCLEKLEVLDLAQNFMVEVPDIIWKMSRLRHLYMSDAIFRKPLKIDGLQELETLLYISIDNWTYELSGMKRMYELKKLGIAELDENSDVGKLSTILSRSYPTCLILRGFRFRSMPCLYKLRFPRYLTELTLDGLLPRLPNFPPNIESLKLINTRLDEDPMLILEKLPKLVRLKLRNAYTGRQMVVLRDAFPMLEVLLIEELWSLRNLQIGRNAMRDLEALNIKNCPYLETLPEEIGSMTSLKKLKMVATNRIAAKIKESALISKIRVVDINA